MPTGLSFILIVACDGFDVMTNLPPAPDTAAGVTGSGRGLGAGLLIATDGFLVGAGTGLIVAGAGGGGAV
jgi:hypothetical protein